MKRQRIALPAFFLALGVCTPTFAATDDNPLCAAKERNVREQMEVARAHGNTDRLRGLETSLEKIQRQCTDEALLEEAEDEVRESIEEVEERKQDLEEALEEGDVDEVEDRREKLREATDELNDHAEELESLRNGG